MGIDLEKAGSVVGILDTKQLAFEIIGFEILQSGSFLEDIYRLLINEREGSFHNAGNDAEYTLRLALESIKDISNLDVVQYARLDAMKHVAHWPIPKPQEESRQMRDSNVIPNLSSLLFREKIEAREGPKANFHKIRSQLAT
ncbi:hypothetical protein DL95DRAFT_443258 [Leptodontidium sp. 2 PMI_412]|nr:hypothetical protein BKA61DRAFT_657638 [Leptodontidium sp. MPI-SDFR-AT-0119]KAH9219881.1 hypothetical protein DL95DRAFT_443258 [Leptodontidium sp. 2 PMI_412]